MPHPEGIVPSTASIASTSLTSLRYLGNYAYAYGGVIGVPNSTTTILGPFISGAGFILAEIQISDSSATNDDIRYIFLLNDVEVVRFVRGNAGEAPGYPTILIIPPFTKVEITGYNLTTSSAQNQTATLTGRVYGAE